MNKSILKKKANYTRLNVLKKVMKTGRGHLGGTFSCLDILIALYFGKLLRINTKNLNWDKRDRFILSKGHACLALYSIFMDLGILTKDQFDSYGQDGGLGGQLDINIPGVDFNTGSLGHSVGVGSGMALALKLSGTKSHVFTLIGDSELFEGSVWEALIFAGENNLKNLVCIIDRNRFMVTQEIKDNAIYEKLNVKISSLGWNFLEINGHNFDEISQAIRNAKRSNKPSLILANTIKGKGVSFMENNVNWYTDVPSKEQFDAAIAELEGNFYEKK